MGIARPSGATEGRPPSGSLGAGRGGGATLSFGEGVVPPLFRTWCVRFGEAETPVGARWIRNLSTSRFRGAAGERLEGWRARVGSRRLGVPAGLRGVGSRQGAPFSGPFTLRKASSGSSETNARKSRSYRPQPQTTPQRTRDPPPRGSTAPQAERGRGSECEARVPPVITVHWKAWLSEAGFSWATWQDVWVNKKKFTPRKTKRRGN